LLPCTTLRTSVGQALEAEAEAVASEIVSLKFKAARRSFDGPSRR
jgi:hypothetical protein